MAQCTYRIQGTLIHAGTKQPLPNLRVEAWGAGLALNEPLETALADEAGQFSFTFEQAYLKGLFRQQDPKLFFRIFLDDEPIRDTEGSIQWEPGQREPLVIELELPHEMGQYVEPPEFDRESLLELNQLASKPPWEIRATPTDLYDCLASKAVNDIRETVLCHFEDGSEELLATIRQLDFAALGRQRLPVKGYLRATLEQQQLPPERLSEASRLLRGLEVPETVAALLRPDEPLQANPLFNSALQRGTTYRLGLLTQLDDDKVEQVVDHGLSLDNISPAKLAELVDMNILADSEARALGLNANLYQLATTNLNLVDAIKAEHDPQSLRELVSLSRADWQDLLETHQIDPPVEASRAEYAAFLRKQIELLYPHQTYRRQYQSATDGDPIGNLDRIQDLSAQNVRLFGAVPPSTLDLSEIDAQELTSTLSAYADLNRMVNRYPGLELNTVLDDPALSMQERRAEATRRIELLEGFFDRNEPVPFLSLDYSPGSEDLEQLDLAIYSDDERRIIVNTLKRDQSIYRVTLDVEDAFLLKENGYHGAHQIAYDSFFNFVGSTGLEESVASAYYQNALGIATEITAKFGTILDYAAGGMDWMLIDNTSPAIPAYLQRLEGYSDLFGHQDYCKCQHCQSIISPAAYFFDLMDFLKINVQDKHFTGSAAGHLLNPYQRRRDLWETLPLTCECTHTLVPYLTIILEILENFIASYVDSTISAEELRSRHFVETLVYDHLRNLDPLNSFRQPFHLPLAELEIYLNHFPITRAEIVRTERAYLPGSEAIITQAELGLSPEAGHTHLIM